MSEALWLPGLLVLAAGLMVGLLAAYRLRSSSSDSLPAGTSDLLLKIRDCEARRDELYRRLREADEDTLLEADRRVLEESAARTLQELDRLTAQLPERVKAKSQRRERQTSEAGAATPPSVKTAAARSAGSRHPLLVGFAFGAGLVLVITLLVYWAVRDARPEPAAVAAAPAQATQPPHEGETPLPPELADQIARLETRLATNAEDWQARKELALLLVAGGRFFAAFEQATQVLQRFPDDPDGLLVHGVVRLTMGQSDQALQLLDRVLAQRPDHLQALMYRGLALYQSGSREQALDTWEVGLELAGGSNPQFEELLAMARTGGPPPSPSTPGVGTAVRESGPASVDSESFGVTIELAPGASSVPQATLFVFLRTADDGPPIAARRVASPSFPLQLSLGPSDSMMGAELPETGILVARLDSDGAASTTSDTDLQAEASGSRGQVARLVLDR